MHPKHSSTAAYTLICFQNDLPQTKRPLALRGQELCRRPLDRVRIAKDIRRPRYYLQFPLNLALLIYPDPASGSLIGTCPESTPQDAEQAIRAASAALPTWRTRTGRDRSRILRRWYDLVIQNKEDLATLITWENGKAGPDAAGEVLFAASFLEWFAEEAPRVYGDVIPHSQPGFRVSVLKEPVGVVGLITPYAPIYYMELLLKDANDPLSY